MQSSLWASAGLAQITTAAAKLFLSMTPSPLDVSHYEKGKWLILVYHRMYYCVMSEKDSIPSWSVRKMRCFTCIFLVCRIACEKWRWVLGGA